MTLILTTIEVDFLVIDSILVSNNSIITKISNNKIISAKVCTKTAKSKSKSKNLANFFLAKF